MNESLRRDGGNSKCWLGFEVFWSPVGGRVEGERGQSHTRIWYSCPKGLVRVHRVERKKKD